jgi:hypothetical protein
MAVSAMAMAAITIGALVVLPAKIDGIIVDPEFFAVASAATNPAVRVAAAPSCTALHDKVVGDEYVRVDAAR